MSYEGYVLLISHYKGIDSKYKRDKRERLIGLKTCKMCNIEKPEEQFYKHKQSNLRRVYCKDCYGIKYPGYEIGEYRKIRDSDPEKIAHMRAVQRKYKTNNARLSREYRARNKLKTRARNKTHSLIRAGKLIKKMICECCGTKENIQIHHHDYSDALNISWFCSDCHADWHAEHEDNG